MTTLHKAVYLLIGIMLVKLISILSNVESLRSKYCPEKINHTSTRYRV